MIKKKYAQEKGIRTIDGSATLTVQKSEKLAQLKKLIPNVVNSDNQVDTKALQDFIDIAQTTSNNKGYELTFAGKGIARAKANSETTKELQVEKAQSKNFDTTQNIVIRGDNLEVLKILKQNYFGKVKMIYIDPPYNTKSENFIYNDNFKESESDLLKTYGLDEDEDKETLNFLHNVYGTRSHSGWLSFMYPRLKLARDLLKANGVIFISIDDNEVANLRIMCDEIFGEENFLANIVWQKKYAATNDAKGFSALHDHIIVYQKSEAFNRNLLPRTEQQNKPYKNDDKDGKGLWRSDNLLVKSFSQSGVFAIKNPNTGEEFYPPQGSCWRGSKETIDRWLSENRIFFGKDGKGAPQIKRYLNEVQQGRVPTTWWTFHEVGHNDGANKELKALFSGQKPPFDTPKPTTLIQQMLKISTDQNDLILDFFAGSGTTGDAVMQLNASGEQRKFILVQWDEEIKENTEAHKFCTENNFKPVISSITIERLNRAGEKIKKEQQEKNGMFDNQDLDIGYKVFSLTEKPKLAEDKSGLFVLENERTETINTLINMLCATCKPLHTQITEIEKDKLYSIEEKNR